MKSNLVFLPKPKAYAISVQSYAFSGLIESQDINPTVLWDLELTNAEPQSIEITGEFYIQWEEDNHPRVIIDYCEAWNGKLHADIDKFIDMVDLRREIESLGDASSWYADKVEAEIDTYYDNQGDR